MRRFLISVFLLGTAAVAQSAIRPSDPIFGIDYDPAKVHFDSMPKSVRDRCPELQHYVDAWLYGDLKTIDGEYLIVSGTIKVESEDHPGVFSTEDEEGDGFIVELAAGQCWVDQAPVVLFPEWSDPKNAPTRKIHMRDDEMQSLAAEILVRYAKAFGGKKPFLTQITKAMRNNLPSVFRSEVEKLEQSVPIASKSTAK